MEKNSDGVKDFILFQIERRFNSVFNIAISSIEELKVAGKIDDKKFLDLRKKILKNGNQLLREIESDFSKIEIKLNKENKEKE